jgi:hypothetical protein
VHAHIVDDFKRVPLLLTLERLFGGSTIDNVTVLILKSLMDYGGLIIEHVVSKLTCFASDKVYKLLLLQFKYKRVHYMAHCTNLAMQTFLINLWLLSLRVCCRPFTHIILLHQKGTLNMATLPSFLKLKV